MYLPLLISPHCPEADLYLEGSMKEFKQAFQKCGLVLVALLLPGSSVHGILQARILEWVAMPSSRDLHNPGTEPKAPALQADSLPSEPPREYDMTNRFIFLDLLSSAKWLEEGLD